MWRKMTEGDLIAHLSQGEVDRFRQSAGFTDAVPEVLSATAGLVRAHVRTAGISVAPSPGTIPEELVGPAADYAVFDLLKRFRLPIGEERRTARKDALEMLQKVAERKLAVEGASEESSATPAVSPVAAPPRPHRLLD